MTTEVVMAVEEEDKPLSLPEDLETWETEQEELLVEAQEAGVEYTLPAIEIPGPEHVGRAMRRIGYFDRMLSLVSKPFDEEIAERQKDIAYLQEEIKRLESEKTAACKPWERRKAWYIGPIEGFMRALHALDNKIKSWPTPWGVLALTKRQSAWNYGRNPADEESVATVLYGLNSALVRTKYAIDKAGLKDEAKRGEAVRVWDGQVFVRTINDDGEVQWIPIPGVTVDEDPPPKFEIKPPKVG